jgi:hypothetical protein
MWGGIGFVSLGNVLSSESSTVFARHHSGWAPPHLHQHSASGSTTNLNLPLHLSVARPGIGIRLIIRSPATAVLEILPAAQSRR